MTYKLGTILPHKIKPDNALPELIACRGIKDAVRRDFARPSRRHGEFAQQAPRSNRVRDPNNKPLLLTGQVATPRPGKAALIGLKNT